VEQAETPQCGFGGKGIFPQKNKQNRGRTKMKKQRWTVIKPRSRGAFSHLKEVAAYRDLIFLFAKRNLTVSYKQTILGPLWLVLTPFLSALVSSFVFGGIVKIDSGEVPYFAFYFTAFIAWSYFSTCLSATSNTFSGNAHLFRRVYFPRLVVPLSTVLSSLFRFGVHLLLTVIVLLIFAFNGAAIAPNWGMVWLLPLLLLEMSLLALGCGAILSALTAKYRDLTKVVGLGIDLWKYITPVIYTASSLAGRYRMICLINPMGPMIEAFRYILLGSGGGVYPLYLLLSVAETVAILWVGLVVFCRTEEKFIDTV
jgi:lipopolysaccharide transport system permease protein